MEHLTQQQKHMKHDAEPSGKLTENSPKTTLLNASPVYKPFTYPWAYDAWLTQQRVHWLAEEVPLADDVKDWHRTLTDAERHLVTQIFRFFTQADCEVNNCYLKKYSTVFKPTEVLMMLSAFSNIECFDDETELMTNNGWKLCKNLTTDDVVAQYDLKSGTISFVSPLKVVHYPYKGVMHHYKDKTTDICVTPNHDLILKHPSTGVVSKKKSMLGKWGRNYLYPSAGNGCGESVAPTNIVRLLIVLAADGCVIGNCPSAEGKEWFTVTVSLSKDRKISRLREILDGVGIDYSSRTKKNGEGYDDSTLFSFNLNGYVDHDVLRSIKSLSFIDISSLDSAHARGVLDEILFWDGSRSEKLSTFYSSEKSAIDVVQAVSVVAGISATAGVGRKAGDVCTLPGGKTHVLTKDSLIITFSERRVWRTYPNRKEVDYDGSIHCVSVPTQNIVSRRNGKVAVTGNTVHIAAYSHLLDTLGMPEEEYSAFLKYKEMKDKYDYMQSFNVNDKHEIAKTLAAFGAFTEGLQLFASFAILMNFPRFNKLRGMGQIVSWSVRDESLHCLSIIRLFRTFVQENPEIWTQKLRDDLTDICRTIVEHEEAFIDLAFEMGAVEGLDAAQVKAYIHFIADRRLTQLGLDPVYNTTVNPLPWMDEMLNAVEHANFFENRSTEYSRASTQGTWEEAFAGLILPQID